MDKRDLEKHIKDADWSRLHDVIHNESEAIVRSTADRIVDIMAEMRMNNCIHGKYKYGSIMFTPKEAYLLLLLSEGKYEDGFYITNTNHLKGYIQKIAPSITDEEIDDIKTTLIQGKGWKWDGYELRLKHMHIYSP